MRRLWTPVHLVAIAVVGVFAIIKAIELATLIAGLLT